MRFLLDEDLNPAVAETGRGLGLDVISIHEIGRRGLRDDEQLRLAATDGRIFVTRNRDDFIKLTVDAFQAGRPHFGVLIVPYSLPNHRPEAIAHSLKSWHDRHLVLGDLGSYTLDFLPS